MTHEHSGSSDFADESVPRSLVPAQPGLHHPSSQAEDAVDLQPDAQRGFISTLSEVPPVPSLRRRDRHGRGPRGPVLPRHVPAWQSRSARFDSVVIAVVEAMEQRWPDELAGIEFAVEDVPWPLASSVPQGVPLGRYYPPHADMPPRILVFRRPIEARTSDPTAMSALVRDVIAEQVAQVLGIAPRDVDPEYGSEP